MKTTGPTGIPRTDCTQVMIPAPRKAPHTWHPGVLQSQQYELRNRTWTAHRPQNLGWKLGTKPGNNSPPGQQSSLQDTRAGLTTPHCWGQTSVSATQEATARICCCLGLPYKALHFNHTHTQRKLCAYDFICLPVSRGRGKLLCKPLPLSWHLHFVEAILDWALNNDSVHPFVSLDTLGNLLQAEAGFSRVWREQLVQWDGKQAMSQFLIVPAVRKQTEYRNSYYLLHKFLYIACMGPIHW